MAVTLKDGLFTFGSNQISEVPPSLPVAASGDIEATNDAAQKAPLGVLYRHKGNVYRYVKFDNGSTDQQTAVACAAGGVLHWYLLDPPNGVFTATSAYAAAPGKNAVAGVALNVTTHGYYTWIQVGGRVMAYVVANTAVGDVMVYSSTDLNFGRCAADAAVTGIPFGVAMEARGTTTANKAYVLLLNLIW